MGYALPLSWLLVLTVVASLSAACSGGDRSASESSPGRSTRAADTTRALVVGTAPRGAIVTLTPTTPRELPPATEPAVMDQFGLAFTPALLLARVGQKVEFRNSEDVLHNVRVDEEAGAPVFNVATPLEGTYTHTFDKPGYYNVSCDIHPAMRANILVVRTPYAVVAEDGTFTFRDVEPGPYKLVAFASGRETVRMVEVAGSRVEVKLDSD